MNKNLCCGIFYAGDIEPGTFHTKRVANSSGDCPPVTLPEDGVREDMEAAFAPEGLIPPVETDVVF